MHKILLRVSSAPPQRRGGCFLVIFNEYTDAKIRNVPSIHPSVRMSIQNKLSVGYVESWKFVHTYSRARGKGDGVGSKSNRKIKSLISKADFDDYNAGVNSKSFCNNFIILKHEICTFLVIFNQLSKYSKMFEI